MSEIFGYGLIVSVFLLYSFAIFHWGVTYGVDKLTKEIDAKLNALLEDNK